MEQSRNSRALGNDNEDNVTSRTPESSSSSIAMDESCTKDQELGQGLHGMEEFSRQLKEGLISESTALMAFLIHKILGDMGFLHCVHCSNCGVNRPEPGGKFPGIEICYESQALPPHITVRFQTIGENHVRVYGNVCSVEPTLNHPRNILLDVDSIPPEMFQEATPDSVIEHSWVRHVKDGLGWPLAVQLAVSTGSPPPENSFCGLPDELQQWILVFLPIEDLGRIGQVSRKMNQLSLENFLWRPKFIHQLGLIEPPPGRIWRLRFLRAVRTLRRREQRAQLEELTRLLVEAINKKQD